MNQKTESTFLPTLGGLFSIFLWSVVALLLCRLERIPPLQLLFSTLFLGFLTTLIRATLMGSWSKMGVSWKIWVFSAILILTNHWAYYIAFRYAPPEHADLINYLWPILILLSSGTSRTNVLSAMLGFTGLVFLIEDLNFIPSLGYLFAFLACLSWSFYSLLSRKYPDLHPDLIGTYYAPAALLMMILHLCFEETVVPSLTEGGFIALIGVFISGSAFSLWDWGVRKGEFALLQVFSYFTPLLSIAFLVAGGVVEGRKEIWMATCCITAGGFLAFFGKKRSFNVKKLFDY